MVRSFTAAYATAVAAANTRPYMVLQVEWGTTGTPDTRYYCDRAAGDFEAAGTRVPTLEAAYVTDWGAATLDIAEQQVSATGSRTFKIEDTVGTVRALLDSAIRHQKKCRLYRLFDTASTVWPTDASVVFFGVLESYSYTEDRCEVSLVFRDCSQLLLRDLDYSITAGMFTGCPSSSFGKKMPLALGRAHRVPCPPIVGPVDLRGATAEGVQAVEVGTVVRMNKTLAELGVTAGVTYQIMLGNDPVEGQFSAIVGDDKGCNFTVTAPADLQNGYTTMKAIAWAVWGMVLTNEDGVKEAYFQLSRIVPDTMQATFAQVVADMGDSLIAATYNDATERFEQFDYAEIVVGDPDGGWVKVGAVPYTPDPPFAVYRPVVFFADGDSGGTYPGSVPFRPFGSLKTIYCVNTLPSESVFAVEGWFPGAEGGNLPQPPGFRPIGKGLRTDLVGTTVVTDSSSAPFTITLEDSRWVATLGRSITTIEFPVPPSYIEPGIDDDTIYCSLLGTRPESPSNPAYAYAITNPALVALEMLSHSKIWNIDDAFIDDTSFGVAASLLSGMEVGHAILEAKPGLEWLQNFARQFHSFILLDQGKVAWKVLANSSATFAMSFACGANHEPLATGQPDNILASSLTIADSKLEELVTHISAPWRKNWDDKKPDKTVERTFSVAGAALVGRKVQELQYDALWRKEQVFSEIQFWLSRQCRVWRTVRFTAFLGASKLQPGDWIKVSYYSGVAGPPRSGTFVGIESTSRFAISLLDFGYGDVGVRLVIPTGGGGVIAGVYTVLAVSVDGLDRWVVQLDRPACTTFTASPTWYIYPASANVLNQAECEVRSVSDSGVAGLVEIVARFSKFIPT